MFVQATKSRRKNKIYTSHLVRESFRTAKGPRSRTVCNISGLPAEVREIIGATLQGKKFVPLSELELSSAQSYGGLAVLRESWKRYRLDYLFEGIGSVRQRGLLQAMIFGRILFPCAKLALAEQAGGTALASACGLDPKTETFREDDLYEAMDALNGQWVALEKGLYERAFGNQAVRIVLYDLTSVYFEGSGPKNIAQYGYSRDHRDDRPQVLLAVATDTEGTPIHLEVLRGNRGDTTTLKGLLETLRRRFGIREVVFVFDGGMSSRFNLQEMEQKQLHYITRLSSKSLSKLLQELPKDQQPELWDRTRLMDVISEGKRYVIAGGPWRQQRDAQRRTARLFKAEEKLKKLAAVERKKVDPQKLASQTGRSLQALKAHKYFDYRVDEKGQLHWNRKTDLITAEEMLDGWYLLHTDLPAKECPSSEVLKHYKNLLEVEEAFCQLKSYLQVRPVFHWRTDRVRNHMRICFLAYWLSAKLGKEWRAQGEKGETPRLLRLMQTIRVGTLCIKGKIAGRLMTQIPQNLNALLKKLDMLKLFAQPPDWIAL